MEPLMNQIGEVAQAVGLSLRTIRYYEETGLVLPSGRSTGGFRLYTDSDIERLRLVKQMKPLELTIDEMRELLTVRDRLADPSTSSQDRRDLVDRLTMFAELAEQRCQRLRERLEAGERLSATLRAETNTASRSPRDARRGIPPAAGVFSMHDERIQEVAGHDPAEGSVHLIAEPEQR